MSKRTEIRRQIIQLLQENTADSTEKCELFSKNFDKIDLRGLIIDMLILNNIDFIDMINNGCHFNNCHFDSVKFSRSDFRGVKFDNVSFSNVIFNNSSIIGVNFVNCNFKNVKFYKCDLTGSNFGNSQNKSIEFYSCNFYKTDIVKENFFSKFSSLNIFDYYYHHVIVFFLTKKINIIPKLLYLVCRLTLHCDIPLHSIDMGNFCRFGHLGFSTLVVGGTKIGDNTWIGPNVNIFSRNKGNLEIGKNVIIGIGSRISANIGNNVIIGAGALVLDDVPDNAIVYGQKSEIS